MNMKDRTMKSKLHELRKIGMISRSKKRSLVGIILLTVVILFIYFFISATALKA